MVRLLFRLLCGDVGATAGKDDNKFETKELFCNEIFYDEIKKYKKSVLDTIKNDYEVEVRYCNKGGEIYALAMGGKPNTAPVAVFSNNEIKKYEMIFHGIDTSKIEQENEKILKLIDELKEIIDAERTENV
ncbi:hypothetical protein OFO10_02265 [Campylobacter sp. VBCF_06 NA8]|uniref:hypothetical protein n=1 Tax=Campylobacter sp. VBCF_06 NA8 TaxID=2983822 RepID=UPI0022E9F65E|nr:hypothetical protein [Campylobacter sp. VBCF_06 NA8]MDA3045979.1 hypothetical protein [Campylobacter sp. VBCF_06 NA8]